MIILHKRRGGFMCGAMVGCAVCEGLCIFHQKMHVYLICDLKNVNW